MGFQNYRFRTNNFFIFANMFYRRLAKPRVLLKIGVFLIIFMICYLFGLFTHIYEKDLEELEIPTKVNIQEAVHNVKNHLKSVLDYDDVNQLNFDFLHHSKHTCSPSKSNLNNNKQELNPYLIILVKSRLGNFQVRETIRNTWAQRDKLNLIRTVFLVGIPDEGDRLMSNLELENRQYNDIVQQNFVDTYFNNTLKTLMGLRWINTYCMNSKYFLFIDDDFYLNPNLLMSYLKNNVTNEKLETLYEGYVFPNSSPMRHLISKWYISLDEYEYHKFPPFIAAGCYVLSKQTAQKLYLASRLVKIFRFDDIYLALLAFKLGIKPTHLASINYYAPPYETDTYANQVISAHDFAPDELTQMWKELEQFIQFKPDTSYLIK